MKVYTKQGDDGQSELSSGRCDKFSVSFELLGDVDELSAAIGCANTSEAERWLGVQTELLDLGSAASGYSDFAQGTTELEAWIDALTAELPPLKNFVLPLGSASQWHLARAVCRRAERHCWQAMHAAQQDDARQRNLTRAGQYLNRLSDLLFQQARVVAEGDVRYKQSKGLF